MTNTTSRYLLAPFGTLSIQRKRGGSFNHSPNFNPALRNSVRCCYGYNFNTPSYLFASVFCVFFQKNTQAYFACFFCYKCNIICES